MKCKKCGKVFVPLGMSKHMDWHRKQEDPNPNAKNLVSYQVKCKCDRMFTIYFPRALVEIWARELEII